MLLSLEEAHLFFKLHRSLMQFVNERLKVVVARETIPDFRTLSPNQRREVVKAFLGRLDLIDEFVAANPSALSPDDLEIVSSWQHLVAGHFIALRQLQKYMIFLPCKPPPVAYGVLGLTEALESVIVSQLPAMVETVLLPFRGQIIYDGLVARFNVIFGGGAKSGFEHDYLLAKESFGVVTSLPAPATPIRKAVEAKRPKPSRAPQQPAQEVNVIFERISGMTDAFCEARLNDEYAVLCRKLAEKLARKRPSPLLGGRAEIWACGIVRTIGWVNLLDSRVRSPFMKLTAIDKAFGLGQSTGQQKSKDIRRLLKIRRFDHRWTLPSQWEQTPGIWLLESNGFIIDIRDEPISMQRAAFEKGLIPYIPAQREAS